VALVNTVSENQSQYTNRDYNRAVLARNIQKMIGRPSTRAFIKIVDGNLLPNCPITRQDIVAAEKIVGKDVGSLKGKTVRSAPTRVEGLLVSIPPSLMSKYRNVTIAYYIMFVTKIPFFIPVSRHIKFGSVEMIPNQQIKTVVAAVKKLKNIYSQRGFNVVVLVMDMVNLRPCVAIYLTCRLV
jgi:hypothetical protein